MEHEPPSMPDQPTDQPGPAPTRPDIEIQATPYEHGTVLGRHPDGSATIFLRGELKIRVNPPPEPPATPPEEWAFPTIELQSPANQVLDAARRALALWESGSGRDTETCDAMIALRASLDALDQPGPDTIPELYRSAGESHIADGVS